MSTENIPQQQVQQNNAAGTVILLIFLAFFVFIALAPGGTVTYGPRPPRPGAYYNQRNRTVSAPPQQLNMPNISIPKGISFLHYGARMNESQRMQRTMMIIGAVVLIVVAIVTIVLVSIKKKKTENKE